MLTNFPNNSPRKTSVTIILFFLQEKSLSPEMELHRTQENLTLYGTLILYKCPPGKRFNGVQEEKIHYCDWLPSPDAISGLPPCLRKLTVLSGWVTQHETQ